MNADSSVGEIVRENPNRARVFEAMGIDYCCGGKKSLANACDRQGVSAEEVLEQIGRCDRDLDSEPAIDPDAMSLTDLAEHIERTHHDHLRNELPRLDMITEKVARVHGDKDARLQTVREAFVALKAELEPHMLKEERILFPIVRQLESQESGALSHCGSVANPVSQMEHEHEEAGKLLSVLREATDDYQPPEWACNTYRAMLDSLKRLELDMHQHIHKENNVLFPKAIELAGA